MRRSAELKPLIEMYRHKTQREQQTLGRLLAEEAEYLTHIEQHRAQIIQLRVAIEACVAETLAVLSLNELHEMRRHQTVLLARILNLNTEIGAFTEHLARTRTEILACKTRLFGLQRKIEKYQTMSSRWQQQRELNTCAMEEHTIAEMAPWKTN